MGFLLGGAADYAPRSGRATRWALQWLLVGWGLRTCSQLDSVLLTGLSFQTRPHQSFVVGQRLMMFYVIWWEHRLCAEVGHGWRLPDQVGCWLCSAVG